MYKPNKASKSFTLDFKPRPFSLMTKPAGPLCNLNCTYCYYLEKYKLYNDRKITGMPDSLLEEFVKQYIDSQPVSDVIFVWQGGEPCLAGLSFYHQL